MQNQNLSSLLVMVKSGAVKLEKSLIEPLGEETEEPLVAIEILFEHFVKKVSDKPSPVDFDPQRQSHIEIANTILAIFRNTGRGYSQLYKYHHSPQPAARQLADYCLTSIGEVPCDQLFDEAIEYAQVAIEFASDNQAAEIAISLLKNSIGRCRNHALNRADSNEVGKAKAKLEQFQNEMLPWLKEHQASLPLKGIGEVVEMAVMVDPFMITVFMPTIIKVLNSGELDAHYFVLDRLQQLKISSTSRYPGQNQWPLAPIELFETSNVDYIAAMAKALGRIVKNAEMYSLVGSTAMLIHTPSFALELLAWMPSCKEVISELVSTLEALHSHLDFEWHDKLSTAEGIAEQRLSKAGYSYRWAKLEKGATT